MQFDLTKALEELDPADVGHRLKEARLAAGMKQPQAAAGVVSVGYLSRIERGERRANAFVLEQLCRNIGVSPESIINSNEATDDRRVEVELDFAELELLSGDATAALTRLALTEIDDDLPRSPLRDRLRERKTLTSAKAHAALGHVNEAQTDFAQVMQQRTTSDGTLEASLGLSRLKRETGDLHGAIAIAEQALAAVENAPAPVDDVVKVSMALAAAVYEAGDTNRALAICTKAVQLAESADSTQARAAAYWNTAIIECEAGRMEQALSLTRRALAVFAGADDARLEARLRTQLGIFLLRADPPAPSEAIAQLTQARDTYQHTDADTADILHNRMALARAHFAAGDVDAARSEADYCALAGEQYPFVGATATTLLGRIAVQIGTTGDARTHFLRAIHFLSAVGADRRAAQQWFTLATLLDEAGLDAEAKDAFKRAAVSSGLTPSYGNSSSHTADSR
ncbi:helix-turn-helix domain-containing protein [Nocardioides sp.]|uniref:helix-turn-helix domain-containing protein n=1 Tax=Nocardioides sp. TaxID=35761 RepID=UPI00271B7ACC|nr:helix-turn-helix domain-containing protein [Nocardioides sp.]MDO9455233.1 helix-turn-helix domain-containing protein [Nocardioides sp.]